MSDNVFSDLAFDLLEVRAGPFEGTAERLRAVSSCHQALCQSEREVRGVPRRWRSSPTPRSHTCGAVLAGRRAAQRRAFGAAYTGGSGARHVAVPHARARRA
jgi:hypothetical protein